MTPDLTSSPTRACRSARGPLVAAVTLATVFGLAIASSPASAVDEPTGTTVPSATVAPTTAPPPTAPTVPTTAPAPAPPPTAPPAPAAKHVKVVRGQIAHILATIRYVESRGNYGAPPNRGNASGAYQFIASTWDGFGGYPHAYLAPPEIQDERAALDVQRFLDQWHNDVSMIPVMWYYPRASRDLALMDIVPVPSAGNILTVREYQQRWLGVWSTLSGQPIPPTLTLEVALARLGLPPELPLPQPIDPAVERKATVAFPVLGPTRIAAPECGDANGIVATTGASLEEVEAAGLCADAAPGIVFGVKLQPVLSVADGVVTDVVDQPGEPISVTVTDTSGRGYRLAGFNDDNPGTDDGAAPPHLRLSALARVGQSVRAGQVLGFMGNSSPLPLGIRADVPTDKSVVISPDDVAPHIRLTIRDLDGTPVDSYGPVIDALFRQVCSVGTGPWSGPPSGSGLTPVVIETTDDNRLIDSQWVITGTGQVTATGWAAMIYPGEGCGFAPPEARGPGAGGPPVKSPEWLAPIELPTSLWIDLALDGSGPALPIVRR